jgi:hypothetical protein
MLIIVCMHYTCGRVHIGCIPIASQLCSRISCQESPRENWMCVCVCVCAGTEWPKSGAC